MGSLRSKPVSCFDLVANLVARRQANTDHFWLLVTEFLGQPWEQDGDIRLCLKITERNYRSMIVSMDTAWTLDRGPATRPTLTCLPRVSLSRLGRMNGSTEI